VLGCGTTVFEDLFEYMASLKNLRAIVEKQQLKHIYPGHGPVITNKAVDKIDEYLRHRSERELQILATLRADAWLSSCELVCKVYGSQLSFIIKISALLNLTHHLHKLQREGKVEAAYPALWKIQAK